MLNKQQLTINFVAGLDQKTDPFQIAPMNFLRLKNVVFTNDKMIQKRNGFASLPSLADASVLTTFGGNLLGIGTELSTITASNSAWVTKGQLQPVTLDTLSLVRSNTSQTQLDTATSSNGLICVVFTDNTVGSVTY